MPDARTDNLKWTIVVILAAMTPYALISFLAIQDWMLPYYLQILGLCCINITLVVSLNLINGFTGQFSIGHAGFMAIGAYLAAALTKYYHMPFLISTLSGGLVAAFIGILIGLPTLRLRGDYLAIATLGFGEIIRVVILNTPSVGGPTGFAGIPKLTSFGHAYLLVVLTVLVVRNLVNSDHGRACVAIREDELASETLGINTTYYKVCVFAIGAMFAGMAGSLLAHYMQFIAPTPSQIGFLKSIDLLIMLVLGGLGSITGSVIAATFLTILPEALRQFAQYRMLVYPVLLIAIMLFRPSGLMGGRELSIDFLKSLFYGKRAGREGEVA